MADDARELRQQLDEHDAVIREWQATLAHVRRLVDHERQAREVAEDRTPAPGVPTRQDATAD